MRESRRTQARLRRLAKEGLALYEGAVQTPVERVMQVKAERAAARAAERAKERGAPAPEPERSVVIRPDLIEKVAAADAVAHRASGCGRRRAMTRSESRSRLTI